MIRAEEAYEIHPVESAEMNRSNGSEVGATCSCMMEFQ
jgi:hypothetical protein